MDAPYAKFKIASPYGNRIDPIDESNAFHAGLDLVSLEAGDSGKKVVRSAKSGVVVRSRMVLDSSNRTSEWGNYVAILSDVPESGGSVEEVIYYCHLAERLVESGERVEAGEAIGIEGSTGRSTGNHLHFEVRQNGVSVNPAPILGIPNETGYVYDGVGAANHDKNLPHEWAGDAVEWAEEYGIMLGGGDGNLRLGDAATREECVLMLYRLWKTFTGK